MKKIEEALDFGREEGAGHVPVMAVVTLEDPDRKENRIKVENDLLYSRNIHESDKVYFDERNKLNKVLDEDWTKRCTTQTVDTTVFVDMMQTVKAGRKIEWKCVFCGGNVGLINQDDTKTVIGCDSCDMRINLESN